MTNLTKQRLAAELRAAETRNIRLENQIEAMREIVSIEKCLITARELLAEQGGTIEDAQLLANFISRIWWIDVEPEHLGRGETTTPLPPLSPKG